MDALSKICPKCGKPMQIESWTVIDYKKWGSYRVARALGMVEHKAPSQEVYKTSGKWGKAGDHKMVSVFTPDTKQADLFEQQLQLNRYRMKLEAKGIKIGKMQLQIDVRDGGLSVARSRGIDFNIKLIPIERLEDSFVEGYFSFKEIALLEALEMYQVNKDYMPVPCNLIECWDGNRCKGYCDVSEFCPKGMLEQVTIRG